MWVGEGGGVRGGASIRANGKAHVGLGPLVES